MHVHVYVGGVVVRDTSCFLKSQMPKAQRCKKLQWAWIPSGLGVEAGLTAVIPVVALVPATPPPHAILT